MTELSKEVLRLAESGQFATLTKLILDTEARMEKLEFIADSARKFGDAHIQFQLNRLSVAEYAGFYNSFHSALKALEDLK